MPGINIPLAIGISTRAPAEQPRVVFKNFILEHDYSGATNDQSQVARIQRPGLTAYRTVATGTQVRGVFHTQGLFGSLPVAVVGTTAYKFDNSTSTSLGTISGTDKVQFAPTNFGLGILGGGVLYFYQNSDSTIHTIAIPNSDTPVSICDWNSYIIVGCSNGKWYWVVPGDLTIDALHFATAESMPDNLVAVARLGDEVFMFGTETVEVWQGTGDPDAILVPAEGRRLDYGCMARDSVAKLDNSLWFVSSTGLVYNVNGDPPRISNPGIEERIRNRSGNVYAYSYLYDGHSYYSLNVPGQGTYTYDVSTDKWSEFASAQLSTGWLPQVACMFGSNVLLGDSTSGKVFELDATINKDDGTIFERAVSGVVPFTDGRQRNDSIEVWVGSSGTFNLRLRWHDGPETAFGSYVTELVTEYPQAAVRFTRIGAARMPLRTVEFSTVDDVQIRISGASANSGRVN